MKPNEKAFIFWQTRRFWLNPCRRRNYLTPDDRIEAMARAREYLERKKRNDTPT